MRKKKSGPYILGQHQLQADVFHRYMENPLDDSEVRRAAGVPDDKYYSVSMWPRPGLVTIENRDREPRRHHR